MTFAYPFFLNTPLGIEADFKLFRRDTTFIDLISRLGVNYTLRRGEFVRLFIENKSSNLLSRNRFINQTNNELPPFGDIRLNLFGVGYRLNRLDYRFNPRKGLMVESSFAVGRKRLQKIAALEELQPNLYKDVKLNTIQYNGDLSLSYFLALGGRSTLLMRNQSATTFSENLYRNELLRIGGLKLLRGFDEESINVSTYSIFTLEYRFLLDQNSFFSLFSDGGYYESNSIGEYVSDTPWGIGAGISFETAAGIFTFNYAIGRQFNNPFDIRAAKIHFGFINFF
jgi:outer membrane protein assembly factor BamA